jgi:hypothetical protein
MCPGWVSGSVGQWAAVVAGRAVGVDASGLVRGVRFSVWVCCGSIAYA